MHLVTLLGAGRAIYIHQGLHNGCVSLKINTRLFSQYSKPAEAQALHHFYYYMLPRVRLRLILASPAKLQACFIRQATGSGGVGEIITKVEGAARLCTGRVAA